MKRAGVLPARSPAVQYLQKPPALRHRGPRACRALPDHQCDGEHVKDAQLGPEGTSNPGSSAEPSANTRTGTDSSSSINNNGHAAAPQQPAPPASASSNGSSKQASLVQNFPPKRPQQQRKQLDVNRAVRLLKLTAWRKENKDNARLPPWFMRTRDDFDNQQGSWNANPTSSTSSNAGSNGTSSSRGKPLAAIDTLDDILTDELQQASSSSSSEGAMGSRWRSGSPASNSSGDGSSSSGSSRRRGRMYSASDPIRRPKSRSGTNEWSLLPWQENGDGHKEEERKFRRAVFSFERWAAHRSTWRYLRHFRGIFSSRTLQGLLPAVAFFTGMAALAGVYNSYAVAAGAPSFALSKTSLDITAFAVSLLLVFRTDSSYARWEEALKTWNEVRSLSKDLARQSCYWVNETARKEMLIRWSEAFSRALLVHCREDGCLESELEELLQPHEVAAVAAVGPGGAPAFVLQVISELVEQCGVSDIKEDKLFSTLRAMGDTIATCDKLLRYPLPLAWSRHTSRFMFLWLSALPWSMWPDAHWSVVPITAVVSYLLLGIDEIGVQIEEPFGILPLEDVCIDIQSEIDAMMERQDIVTDLLVAGGVDCEPRSTCGACGRPIPGAPPPAEAAAAAATAVIAKATAAGLPAAALAASPVSNGSNQRPGAAAGPGSISRSRSRSRHGRGGAGGDGSIEGL